ncbi:carboxypeptidase regulatory-like domain-containing protein [Microbacterium sp. NPDC019599]|uniref:carboxypeptidase regulatory-like domain-containing protein n=1 Tax=Microbacterium sp. NPDC019599 TaxID=3154690 RepID=UPI0034067803
MGFFWNSAVPRAFGVVFAAASVLTVGLIASPAVAEESVTGSLAGTVTDQSGAPVENVFVTAIGQGAFEEEPTWGAITDASGRYRFDGIPIGGYKVLYETGGALADVAGEWWDDARTRNAAAVVSVSTGDLSEADAELAPGAALGGTVTDGSGAAVGGAQVVAYLKDPSDPSGWVGQAWGTTADDGTYLFTRLPAGAYKVTFGSGSDGIIPESWLDDQGENPTVIALEAGQWLTGISPTVVRAGAIAGVVTDDAGAPLEGVSVSARAVVVPGYPSVESVGVVTDPEGRFALGGLPAGEYAVRFAPQGSSANVVAEWWDDSPGADSASRVIVRAGSTVSDVNASLAAGATIAGTVRDGHGSPMADASVAVYRVDGTFVTSVASTADGAFSVPYLPADSYQLEFSARKDGGVLTEWWDDAASRGAASVISLAAGETVENIDAILAESDGSVFETYDAGLSGVVKDAEGDPIANVIVEINSVDQVFGATVMTNAEGEWSLGGMTAGNYVVAFIAVIDDEQLITYWGGASDFATATVIHLTRGEKRIDISTAFKPKDPLPLSFSTPTVAGVARVGGVLAADPGEWTEDAQFSYQWLANGAAIPGATDSSFELTSAQRDKQISVRVSGHLAGYLNAAATSAKTAKVALAGTPTVSGSARVGSTLTAAPGAWTASTALSYQWYADDVAISGATKSTFVVTSAQDSKRITVRVKGTKSGYATVSMSSAPTSRVMRFSTPSISGTLTPGAVLTAKPNSWSAGTTFSYQWYANGAAISGATGQAYTVTSSQRDKQFAVKVTGRQAGFTSVAKTSAATSRVTTAATPSISGTLAVGSKLTAKPNTWTSGVAFSYQWYANGAAISGATGQTFVPGSAQRGTQLTVKVTGRKSGYGTVAKVSAPSKPIATVSTPGIAGSAVVGATLTAKPGTWTSGTTFTYQWFVSGTSISGATGSTFRVTRGHVNKTITVKVTGALSGYQTIARTSAATSAVRSGKAAPLTKDDCPSSYPIKGNQTTQHTTDWIYHVPGGRYYAVTDPEECFATEGAAVAWGYRRSMQ